VIIIEYSIRTGHRWGFDQRTTERSFAELHIKEVDVAEGRTSDQPGNQPGNHRGRPLAEGQCLAAEREREQEQEREQEREREQEQEQEQSRRTCQENLENHWELPG
jgi:hypothetical protein